MRYIALLRGINVGGNTMIKMAELKTVFEKCGFKNVVTYINSGNLAFDVAKSAAVETKLITKIETAIEKSFGKQIPVMVREQTAITDIITKNPFEGQFESHKEMHVLFMKDEMPAEKQKQLLDQQTPDERFAVNGREIYCHLKLGVAESLLGKGFIDKKLKVPITGRNWRTVEKLATL
jgi:uncharacterized protein (DUF1697 family)